LTGKSLTCTSVKTKVGSGEFHFGAPSLDHPKLRLGAGALSSMVTVELREVRKHEKKPTSVQVFRWHKPHL
jgi:hypothetical protein